MVLALGPSVVDVSEGAYHLEEWVVPLVSPVVAPLLVGDLFGVELFLEKPTVRGDPERPQSGHTDRFGLPPDRRWIAFEPGEGYLGGEFERIVQAHRSITSVESPGSEVVGDV